MGRTRRLVAGSMQKLIQEVLEEEVTELLDRAIAVTWKMLMVAESRFRKLKAPELMKDVCLGAVYKGNYKGL